MFLLNGSEMLGDTKCVILLIDHRDAHFPISKDDVAQKPM
jgi:hypothetical protein